jgi:hypothetical protein
MSLFFAEERNNIRSFFLFDYIHKAANARTHARTQTMIYTQKINLKPQFHKVIWSILTGNPTDIILSN